MYFCSVDFEVVADSVNSMVFERGVVYIASHSQAQTVGLERGQDGFLVLVIFAFDFAVILVCN